MSPRKLMVLLTVAGLAVTDRMRRLRESRERGSETTEKVMWIALLVALVLAVYAVFNTKILAKINSINL